ncbi:TM2 domain-containing protein [Alcaligenes sp. 1735tsa3]|uniref:TM2 domain-containing protein n=1 Tax=Alcaligenes TaxID=507 RepID=UPI0020A70B32|nr:MULTISPECIES: TM2 domain-containing protein [Alcaligenes]USY27136.1 TM2 domain-containing protein [Alcaligenes sp. 1735tsa3]UUO12777.1 TM2 domain-containing protein [Alcaligenes faecalis]
MSTNNSTAQAMLYDANKKSLGVTYLLWFFLGTLGGHRFYMDKTGSAIAILVLTILGALLSVMGVGLIMLGVALVWVLVDAFLIPGWVRNKNTLLATSLSNNAGLPG